MKKVDIEKELELYEEGVAPTPKFSVVWTGKQWSLCCGEWQISVNGNPVDLPEEIRTAPMNTFGTYSRWSFGDNWEELWETYEDGLMFPEWAAKNNWWLEDLHLSVAELQELYEMIAEQDWRHCSCGGCI